MTVGELMAALQRMQAAGHVSPDSDVVVEGHSADLRFVQASVKEASCERRCEEDHELTPVYLVLDEDMTIDD